MKGQQLPGGNVARSNDIMKQAVGIDYTRFVRGRLAFDYQAMMTEAGLQPGRSGVPSSRRPASATRPSTNCAT